MITMIFLIILLVLSINAQETEDPKIYTISDEVDIIGKDIFFVILHPPELAFTYRIRPTEYFGTSFNESLLEKTIELVPAEPAMSCTLPSNANELKNRVALIQRGDCTFFQKTLMAQQAGAKAAIISGYPLSAEEDRDSPLWGDLYYHVMSIDGDVVPDDIKIPAGYLLGKNGRIIRETLKRLQLPYASIKLLNLTITDFYQHRHPSWALV